MNLYRLKSALMGYKKAFDDLSRKAGLEGQDLGFMIDELNKIINKKEESNEHSLDGPNCSILDDELDTNVLPKCEIPD